MKTKLSKLFASLVLISAPAFAQSIEVTPTGVEIGATATGATGAVIKHEGSEVSILTKDGVNPAELQVVVTEDGNVGVGVAAPDEKLEVEGNVVVSGSATVGALIVGASPIFTEGYFESAELALPGNGGTITVPHSLGGLPRFSFLVLRCVEPEFGWLPGTEIMIGSIHMLSNNHGVTVGARSNEFRLRQYGYIYVHRYDINNIGIVTPAKWRLLLRAWR